MIISVLSIIGKRSFLNFLPTTVIPVGDLRAPSLSGHPGVPRGQTRANIPSWTQRSSCSGGGSATAPAVASGSLSVWVATAGNATAEWSAEGRRASSSGPRQPTLSEQPGGKRSSSKLSAPIPAAAARFPGGDRVGSRSPARPPAIGCTNPERLHQVAGAKSLVRPLCPASWGPATPTLRVAPRSSAKATPARSLLPRPSRRRYRLGTHVFPARSSENYVFR